MGEVIPFLGSNNEEPEPQPELVRYTDEEVSHIDFAKVPRFAEFLIALSKSDPNFAPHANERQIQLVDLSDLELLEIITNSAEADWQSHPSYYLAILREIFGRGLIGPEE